jgi:hypothetical protein
MTRLLDFINSNASPEGLMPQGVTPGASRLTAPALPRNTLHAVVRLRRFFRHWAAATTAYHERQIALCELHRLEGLDHARIYRGPIDHAVEKATKIYRRSQLRHS